MTDCTLLRQALPYVADSERIFEAIALAEARVDAVNINN